MSCWFHLSKIAITKYKTLYGLIEIYELLIILVSIEDDEKVAVDRAGRNHYGDKWRYVMGVSNTCRHNFYDVEYTKSAIVNFLKSGVVFDIAKNYDIAREDAEGFVSSVCLVLTNM